MPYIITTTVPANRYDAGGLVEANVRHETDRRAVATLDEARNAAASIVGDYDAGSFNAHCRADDIDAALDALPESGGTVGPLPDGTIIEVERVTYDDLGGMIGWESVESRIPHKLIDLYNDAA